jgi:DNA-binding transcriptional LysR family regulator
MSDALRLGFVTGTTPDRWARAWREQGRGRLTLVPVTEEDQEAVVSRGEVDLALVRLPVASEDLHVVRLYDELPVVVASRDHPVAAAETVTVDELADEQLVRAHPSGWRPTAEQHHWPQMTEREAIATAASGVGVVVVPMSVARLHQRRDVVHLAVTDLPPTTIALVWLRERDDDLIQALVGVVRGRTARSSRG